jgi:hypothetical protein
MVKKKDPVEINQTYVEDMAIIKFLGSSYCPQESKFVVAMLWRIAKALEKK